MNFKDKVVLVTGGSRGIGFEIARALLEQSAKVIICGRKEKNLESARQNLPNPDHLTTIAAHIAKPEDVDAMFEQISASFGCLDILINNVGMNLMTPGIADLDPGVWQKIMDSNLGGTFLVSRKAAFMMRDKKQGKIVSISSVAATKASPGMGIYGIAKAGIEMMTKVLASELAAFNVQVNAVAPAMVRTEFSKPFWGNEEFLQHIVKGIPMGRIAEPEEIVAPVLFLASQGASYITGQTLIIDGGSTII
ncbi:MAG: SDR family oxidoreductase [Proteobacteria bacterium]|nr:SDR family oxidoreductase [Pseudomonadota bacterium]MBU1388564.1 SDR family oxidoreductase [Pseudomonadota bacterium]MBU1541388.1 SDR family oxidoreductase [Pseudomonadota bacterium]MBU2480929.1 SDR family oxidoreductase [Pseudomonadota bacterium]